MKNINIQLLEYVESKKRKLAKEAKYSSILDNFIKWALIILNLTIIAIAITVIVIEVNRYNSIPAETRKSFFDELGLTIVLASFIVLTFLFNLFLSIYREVMKFKDYKQAMRKITYITYKLREDENYSKEQFDKEFNQIEKDFLAKKQVSKGQLIKKFILGGGK
ncbi:hypothetical protein [Mycoplasma sp. 480]|uniref:hypothetical protein n=1 Tax=Mycoplasma sp. 480 TaxID=3440155 RepID=UPI003F5191D2